MFLWLDARHDAKPTSKSGVIILQFIEQNNFQTWINEPFSLEIGQYVKSGHAFVVGLQENDRLTDIVSNQ